MPGSESLEVYVVDDDPSIRLLVAAWLEAEGYAVRVFDDGADLFRGLSRRQPMAICLDLMMPGLSGEEVLERLRERGIGVPVLVLTAKDTVEAAVRCMQLGALDYVLKPLQRKRLLESLEMARRQKRRPAAVAAKESSPQAAPSNDLHGILGRSTPVQALIKQVHKVAMSDISVFISGESGTGKELVANAIHQASPRRGGPFIALNCGAIPESLQESELFGHEKGAFTGANTRRVGRFEQAQGGTLFLDEVAELSPASQVRLLRIVQERRLERVGGTESVDLDIRIVCATHRPLKEMVEAGSFREDLYYRLAVYPLQTPPLRERGGDVALLARHFLQRYAQQYRLGEPQFTAEALELLSGYPWPGNVRELENVVHSALVRAEETVLRRADIEPFLDLELPERAPTEEAPSATPTPEAVDPEPQPAPAPAAVAEPPPAPTPESPVSMPAPASLSMADAEKQAIVAAIEASGGNMSQAARELGIGRATLYRKLARYGLRSD